MFDLIRLSDSDSHRILASIVAGDDHGDRGWLVIYADGYVSWSPSQTFEDGYHLLIGEYAESPKSILHDVCRKLDMPEGCLYEDMLKRLEKVIARAALA